eukprot:6171957-Pleurochrysis_carterae.AAC.3
MVMTNFERCLKAGENLLELAEFAHRLAVGFGWSQHDGLGLTYRSLAGAGKSQHDAAPQSAFEWETASSTERQWQRQRRDQSERPPERAQWQHAHA